MPAAECAAPTWQLSPHNDWDVLQTKVAGLIEANNFLMMHFRRFHSFSSFPKCENFNRSAALRI